MNLKYQFAKNSAGDMRDMMMDPATKLILASASPRRKDLLRQAGLTFKTLPAHVDETYLPGERPRAHVRRLSRDKASAIACKHPDAWVLGADTIVVIDNLVLGKPQSRRTAREMLARLANREHEVFTGFTLTRAADRISVSRVVRSAVRFKAISAEEMDWYVGCDEPYDKAGGYAVQGLGAFFIRSIRGSYTNVIGLPLCETIDEMRRLKIVSFGKDHG